MTKSVEKRIATQMFSSRWLLIRILGSKLAKKRPDCLSENGETTAVRQGAMNKVFLFFCRGKEKKFEIY